MVPNPQRHGSECAALFGQSTVILGFKIQGLEHTRHVGQSRQATDDEDTGLCQGLGLGNAFRFLSDVSLEFSPISQDLGMSLGTQG